LISSGGTCGPEDVVIRFTACFDAHDIEGMAQLLADTGVWKRPDGDITGIAELRAFMSRRSSRVFTRHVISNIRATFENESAVVDSYVTVYRHDFADQPALPAPLDGPDVVGRYRDILVNETGTWKLSVRESIVEFKRQ
jgi:hypothetical protein